MDASLRVGKKGQMMTESGAATPCKNMILVGLGE